MSKNLLQKFKKNIPAKTATQKDKELAQTERAKKYGIKVQASAKLTPPASFPTDEKDYGDPVNLAYPIQPENRLRNAAVRLAQMGKTAYKEDPSGLVVVADRIVRAELAAGILPSEDSGVLDLVSKEVKTLVEKAKKEGSAKLKKSFAKRSLAKSLLLESDEMVTTAVILEGPEALQKHDPNTFFITDFKKYFQGFEKRYGHSFEKVVSLIKQNNTEGFHDHLTDKKGGHFHLPTDVLSGEHEHTAENPFGLHAHNEGDPLAGAHMHPYGGLGGHHHNANLNTNLAGVYEEVAKDSVFTSEVSPLEKQLEFIQLQKSLTNLLEVMTFTLEYHLRTFLNSTEYLLNRLARNLKNNSHTRIILSALGICNMLLNDLRFLQFVNGEITQYPGMVEVDENEDNPIESLQKCYRCDEERGVPNNVPYVSHRSRYDVDSANRAIMTGHNLEKTLSAYFELFPEDETFAELRLEMAMAISHVALLNNQMPYILEGANKQGLIRVKDEVIQPSAEQNLPELISSPESASLDRGNSVNYEYSDRLSEQIATQKKKYLNSDSPSMTEGQFQKFMKSVNPEAALLCYPVAVLKAEEKEDIEGRVLGLVLEPGTATDRDGQKQFIKKDAIRRAAYYFMLNHQMLGLQHKTFNKGAPNKNPDFRLLQNVIAESDITINGRVIKEGSWYQEWLVINPLYKKMIKEGKLTGFSIGGGGMLVPDVQEAA